MALASLPAPTSGLFLEVSFRRLLSSCEEIMAGDSKGREDLKSWSTSPLFHHYVDTLQDQLNELTATAGQRIERKVLQQYQQHVAAIAGRLEKPKLPPAAAAPALPNGHARSPPPPLRVPTLPAAALNSHRSRENGDAHLREPAGVPAVAGLAQVGQSSAAAAAAAAAGAAAEARLPPGRAAGPAGPSPAAQARLQTHSNLQETLTEELAGMAASLKSSTLAVEGKLKERGQLLGATETALDHSLTHTRQSAAEAKRIHSKGRLNFCLTLLVMLIVGLTFAGVYVFIKITSFAGYKAARASAPAGPSGGEL